MKKNKNLIGITLILLLTVIIFASFFGIYIKDEYHVVNLVKNFRVGMEFSEKRISTLTLDESSKIVIYDKEGNVVEDDGETEYTEENGYTTVEEKVNSDEVRTAENYQKVVKLLKKRLLDIGKGEYNIALNEETGEIVLELQEDEDIEETVSIINSPGKLEIIDTETEEVLMDNADLREAKVVYGSQDGQTTTIYLELDFNKEGAKKLEEISKIYVKSETKNTETTNEVVAEETTDESTSEETAEDENIKYISVLIDGETYSQTYFGEPMTNGILYIPMRETADVKEIEEAGIALEKLVSILTNGPIEIAYNYDSETKEADITEYEIWIGISMFAVTILFACVYLIIKFKGNGVVASLLQIGYIAVLLLIVRYTNVIITLEGIIGIYLASILNCVFLYVILKELSKEGTVKGKVILNFFAKSLPIYVIAIVLSFMPFIRLSSLGMTLVWGSITMYVYNFIFTRYMLED